MRLRVILDTEDDVFRDIEIETAPLMHLHFAVLDAFGWESGELASFFQSDEGWGRGKEFSLLDMSDPMAEDGAKPEDAMNESTVGHLIPGLGQRAIYVYDFLRMWCFYVEPLGLEDAKPDGAYPALCHEFGTLPPLTAKMPTSWMAWTSPANPRTTSLTAPGTLSSMRIWTATTRTMILAEVSTSPSMTWTI